jgi:hypothetical protein
MALRRKRSVWRDRIGARALAFRFRELPISFVQMSHDRLTNRLFQHFRSYLLVTNSRAQRERQGAQKDLRR